MADQSLVGEVRMLKGWYAFFSPDGTRMRSFPNDVEEADPEPDAWVHDVAGGTRSKHPDAGYDLGWTPDGHVLVHDGSTVEVCDAFSDTCTDRVEVGDGTVKLGGAPYES